MPFLVQVLALTRERAGAEEILLHLAQSSWPVPTASLFGRCGAEEPRVNKGSCVYYGWKESLHALRGTRSPTHIASACR